MSWSSTLGWNNDGWSSTTSGGSFDAATTAWVNAVVADGGTVSGTQKGFVDTLIKGLKTDSLFTLGDALWLYGSEDTHQAKIDIINLATWTNANGLTFTANQGYAGNGSTTFGDTGINGSMTTHFTQNSASYLLYIPSTSGRTTGANVNPFGVFDSGAGHDTRLYPMAASNNAASTINGSGGGGDFAAVATPKGCWAVSRTGAPAANAALYLNGNVTPISSGQSTTSGTPPNGNFFIGALSQVNAAATVNFSSDQMAALWIGSGLSSAQVVNLSNRINTYMTSLGIATY